MMVPAARALSSTLASAAVFLSISAHCARGIAQFPTYEYIGGFSFTSDVCECADITTAEVMVSAHTSAITPPNLFIVLSLYAKVPRIPSCFQDPSSVQEL